MEHRAMQVSELNAFVKDLFAEIPVLFEAWVEGEISNFRRQNSGHIYFTLKDDQAQIRCAMFQRQVRMLRFLPQNELKVLVKGSVTLYERDGTYQIIVQDMEPLGIGALAQALEQLKEKLAAEGLFATERKRALPLYPRCIGIATSQSGAALQDMLNIIQRRYPHMNVIVAPCLVQGSEAADQIAAALDVLNAIDEVDVIIVGRGGGSYEDLWCFNEEPVVRAIARSRHPVISAIGHETDTTLADYAADVRAPTPSAAAELAVPEYDVLQQDILDLRIRLQRSMQLALSSQQQELAYWQEQLNADKLLLWSTQHSNMIRTARERMTRSMQQRLLVDKKSLQQYRERMPVRLAEHWLMPKQVRISLQVEKMSSLMANRMQKERMRLNSNVHKLQLLSPLHTLARGYSLIRFKPCGVVDSVQKLKAGDWIDVEMIDGLVEAQVLQVILEERKSKPDHK